MPMPHAWASSAGSPRGVRRTAVKASRATPCRLVVPQVQVPSPPRSTSSVSTAVPSPLPCPSSAALAVPAARSSRRLAAPAKKPASRTVLAFGDSLTAGMVFRGVVNGKGVTNQHPYGPQLAELLGLAKDDVVVDGRAGECVKDMQQRLRTALGNRHGTPFTHVVILGGTNDLRVGQESDEIYQSLRALHDIVRASGAKCVAVTIPQFGPTDTAYTSVAEPRKRVNAKLRADAELADQGRGAPLWLADLDAELSRLPRAKRDALFSDCCHFTEVGYDMLGEVVHKGVLSAPTAAPAAATAKVAAVPAAPASPNGPAAECLSHTSTPPPRMGRTMTPPRMLMRPVRVPMTPRAILVHA